MYVYANIEPVGSISCVSTFDQFVAVLEMESALPGRLVGWDIHGFRTMEDLDIGKIMEEAKERWLRPNEIHAILCNNKCFSINVRPVNLPKSGRIVLFDRKMLRNFRKDGHNWKKKKDGKTVKEAHEHLKVGDEERIHVYYAHGEDNPTFVRRCYWLLDKKLEHIVLVHYRETQEVQSSPVTPGNSNSSGAHSDPSSSLVLSEEYDSAVDQAYYPGKKPYSDLDDSLTLKNHEMRLHEINTLEWDELLVPDDANKLVAPQDGKMMSFEQKNQHESHGSGNYLSVNSIHMENALLGKFSEESSRSDSINVLDGVSFQTVGDQPNSSIQRKDSEYATVGAGDALGSLAKDSWRTQGSFGQWINDIMADSPGSIDDPTLGSSVSSGHKSLPSCIIDQYQSSVQEQIFSIIEVSPSWAFSTEETKILIIGYFNDAHCNSAKNNLFCVCGDVCVPTEIVHSGVLRCLVPPCSPGFTDLYISIDGQKHISQIVKFEFRPPLMNRWMVSLEDKPNWEEFQVQMRLAHLLFSASKMLNIVSSKVSQNVLKKAKAFVHKTSHIADSWTAQVKLVEENKTSLLQAKDMLFELALQNRLYGWLLEKMVEGCKITDRDKQGQGVIHLCAILGYTWSVYPFSLSGLSLDYRDKFGWTALHWAAYYGREKMVAQLLSAGAKPNLVTDPSPENPGGYTAADLASKNGFDGLAAYLAEKALVQQFKDMSIAGNASGSLQTSAADPVDVQNISEEELYLKDSLAAYRTAADAAARIHSAFRERSFKLRSKAVQFSNPEDEARNIVAAMKIQHAFHNYETRKKMAAAARIQYRFRTWKIRKEFLNMRHQTIKIQAIFRGHQVRKQYQKIVWSVGVLEKAILRWRLKRKGFRGLQVHPDEAVKDHNEESVEHFFQVGRKQAEERNERAVIKVQALFRSKRAQEQYRRMKKEHDSAKLEFEGILNPDVEMGL